MGKSVIEKIIEIVDNRLIIFKDGLRFDRTYYGKLVSIAGNIAAVEINNATVKARIKHGIDIKANDVVIVKSPNGDFSQLYIDGKLL